MFICTIVGILAGLYPSLKASRMNPIQALRYE
jgi:putative ABC transport system permease protein